MKVKGQRLAAIRKIVEEKPISTHQQLVDELEKLGYKVTQATVSRDLTEMGLPKVRIEGTAVYSLPEVENVRKMLRDFVINVERSENLAVVKTRPGTAHSVASSLDGANWGDLLGTVAGDDTVLLITKDVESGKRVMARLDALMKQQVG